LFFAFSHLFTTDRPLVATINHFDETSRKISSLDGSLRDIQMIAGHSSLQTTKRYIDTDSQSQKKIVDLI
jgi:hypothetical protein